MVSSNNAISLITTNMRYTMTPQAAGITAIGVATKPKISGTTYGIFNKNKIGTANTTYPYFPENLAIKQYKIVISIATKIANNGDATYTCAKDTAPANSTNKTDGVNVPNNESSNSAGKLIRSA